MISVFYGDSLHRFVLFVSVIKDVWFILPASGPGRHFPNLFFHWKTAFKASCCHAVGLYEILRLDFRKRGRLLGTKSEQSLRDQHICFHLMYKAISVQ